MSPAKNSQLGQSGQTLIEALVSILALLALIMTLMGTLWLGFLKIRIDFEAHEALICKLTRSTASKFKAADRRSAVHDCELNLRNKISELPGHPVLKNVHWKKSPQEIGLLLEIESKPLQLWKISNLNFTKSLRLPLQDGGRN